MYTVKFNDTIIHDLRFDDLILKGPILSEETNKIASFTFSMLPDHKYYDLVDYGKNEITVLKNDVPIFIGRIASIDFDFYKTKEVECESIIAYFIDSQMRPYDFSGRPLDLWTQLIEQHNAQVDEYKQFKIGTIITDDANDYIVRSSINTDNTYKVINDKLIDTGVWFIDYTDRSVNYYPEFNEIIDQEIVLKENLLDLSKQITDDNFCTRLIPYGADKLDITSVNEGLDYIQDDALIERYGVITKTIEFEDVTVPSNLKTKAEEYLQDSVYFDETISVTAVDLSNVDADIESFKLNYRVRVIVANHDIDKLIRITKRVINLTEPQSDKLTLGTSEPTSTQSNANTSAKVENAFNSDDSLKAEIIKGVVDLRTVNLQAQKSVAVDSDVRAILFEDIDINSPTYGALSIGTQGIQIAREKNEDNLWIWGTAIDFQSIHADYITTGVISDKLGRNTWDLNEGTLNTNSMVATNATINGTITTKDDVNVGDNIFLNTSEGHESAKGIFFDVEEDEELATCIISKKYGQIYTQVNEEFQVYTTDIGTNFTLGILGVYFETERGIQMSGLVTTINSKDYQTSFSLSSKQVYFKCDNGSFVIDKATDFRSSVDLRVVSDKRLKENIMDVDLSDLFDNATVKKYDLKSGAKDKVGVIAQDFEECENKDLILNKDEQGYYGVNYNALLMASMQRIKELEKRLEKLEGK